ncbi:hypothetical protein [Kutzneria buriramensis]|uniref:Uncharacterized protein n=1 Tax=Kutzneria buriramensis TaxID=1045776 RepID=A0A3E0GXX7_9PSEU|nr:hypothetical protein [Kutzneria buriramensis]REH34799.1 hypothetical protein BCF44_11975 [Kutzneria buriramensis]
MNPVLRLARQVGFGRNELRRPVDRVDGLVVGLAVLVGAAIVAAGALFGLRLATYESGVATQQQATRTATTAVLLADSGTAPTALARWKTADGTNHSGPVTVMPQQHAGASVRIWTNAAGAAVDRPIGTLDIVLMVAVALGGGMTVAFLLLRGLLFLVRLPIQRWSAHTWDQDWARTAPRWKQWR